MPPTLPSLRSDLDVMPSPVPEQPGLLLRDPFQYTPAILIVPPPLIPALIYLDGEKTAEELRAFLSQQLGQRIPAEIVNDFVATLREQGFLETEEFYAMREVKRSSFRALPRREPAHAGSAYPAEAKELTKQFAEYMRGQLSEQARPAAADAGSPTGAKTIGIAAPHVSPFGGWRSYAAAYSRLAQADGNPGADLTYVVLGTSHYGEPEKFGLTRKSFATPLGLLPPDTTLIDELARKAPSAVIMEDYCHAVEHSIEFQCVFLQHALGRNARILPVLCGSFHESLVSGKPPETNDGVRSFLEALGEIAEREASRLFWVLGVDMAHIGKRYGDAQGARSGQGRMNEVRERDRLRIERICAGDAAGFYELVRPAQDDLRWCGYSPFYTFLKVMPRARGSMLHYEQWNIDEESVVSFAALNFTRA